MEEYLKLKEMVESLEKDVLKFMNKGNSSAGTRVTVGVRHIKGLADELRKRILQIKKEG